MTIEKFTIERSTGDIDYYELTEDRADVGPTSFARLCGEVAVQISGTATGFSATVERSTRNPDSNPNWAPVGAAISGNPSTGIEVTRYDEPTRAWWRVNVKTLSGGTVTVVFSGEAA